MNIHQGLAGLDPLPHFPPQHQADRWIDLALDALPTRPQHHCRDSNRLGVNFRDKTVTWRGNLGASTRLRKAREVPNDRTFASLSTDDFFQFLESRAAANGRIQLLT